MSMLPVLNGHKDEKGNTLGLVCGASITKQKIGVEHDINKLVAKYKKTGQMPSLKYDGTTLLEEGEIVDLTNVGDYQDCQNKIASARELFDAYPSAIRRRFNNDITEFVGFMTNLQDPVKLNEAVGLGLLTVEKKEDPKPAEPKPAETKTASGDDK